MCCHLPAQRDRAHQGVGTEDRKSWFLYVWAASGARGSQAEGGGLRPQLFARFPQLPGAAQTYQTQDFRFQGEVKTRTTLAIRIRKYGALSQIGAFLIC